MGKRISSAEGAKAAVRDTDWVDFPHLSIPSNKIKAPLLSMVGFDDEAEEGMAVDIRSRRGRMLATLIGIKLKYLKFEMKSLQREGGVTMGGELIEYTDYS